MRTSMIATPSGPPEKMICSAVSSAEGVDVLGGVVPDDETVPSCAQRLPPAQLGITTRANPIQQCRNPFTSAPHSAQPPQMNFRNDPMNFRNESPGFAQKMPW